MAKLSTHVLDTFHGQPAAGVKLSLHALDALDALDGEGAARLLVETMTNADGRTDAPLLSGDAVRRGRYRLVFHIGDYFRVHGVALPDPPLLAASGCHGPYFLRMIVEIVTTDAPAAEIADAPRGAYLIVMTHSHGLDFDIVEAALERHDWAYLGLIGSTSKRAQFERRLAARGAFASELARVTCPIGARSGVTSKEPGAIAVGVAAEILAVRERGIRDETRRTTVRSIVKRP